MIESTRERALLLLPALTFVALVVALPALRVVQLSFMDVGIRPGQDDVWIGLESYRRLWTDGRWWSSLAATVIFTSTSVLLELVLGTAAALLLDRHFRARGLVRTIVVLPWALPTAVMALAWSWIFNDTFGVANDLLSSFGLIDRPIAWLAEPATAMACLVLADVWKTTPFVALIVLAGLQSIPRDVLEAAAIDGLGAWRRLRVVVLPLVLPALVVAAAFRALQAYGAFDLVFVMTGGGPAGSTETISLYAYRNYFRYLDVGYGSAIATQGVVLAAIVAAMLVWLGRRLGRTT